MFQSFYGGPSPSSPLFSVTPSASTLILLSSVPRGVDLSETEGVEGERSGTRGLSVRGCDDIGWVVE